MSIPDTPKVSPELIAEGEKWARERFIAEKGAEIRESLKSHFGAAHDIFYAHRAQKRQQIEAEGGINRIERIRFEGGDSSNAVICDSGERVCADALLMTDPIPLPFETTSPVPEGTKQSYSIAMGFGGEGLGIGVADTHDGYKTTYDKVLDYDALENLLAEDFAPNQIAIFEMMTVKYGEQYHAIPLTYSIVTRQWEARLREEFAPDPFLYPGAYRAWAESGVLKTDISFQTRDIARDEEGRLRLREETPVDWYGSAGGEQAVSRLLRFEELLGFLHERIVPEAARPERSLSILDNLDRKALPTTTT